MEDAVPQVANDGADIWFEVRGAGPLLLLVAGTGYSGATWHPEFLGRLASRHTVLTFDHRGTGRSRREAEGDYTTRGFAHDALAVLRAVDAGPAHVVGHSMGGRVAQHIYFEQPGAVRSLVFCASGAGAAREPEYDRVGIPVGAAQKMIEIGYENYIRAKHRENFFTAQFAQEHPDEIEWLDKAYLGSAPSLHDYLRHVRARQAHSTVARFPEIAVPTLILVGTDDHGGSASHVDSSRAMADLLPTADLVLIDGAKHGIMWENRDRTADLVEQFVRA
jgi:pimeloyl-ACP methyl ester carboxylesterase